ncbi:hypothetical protein JST97_13960 [bacterium]|nr:hypothetical protein [bacterium]
MRRLLCLLLLCPPCLAQTIDYQEALRQLSLKPTTPVRTGVTALDAQGETLLLVDARNTCTYHLPDLRPLQTLPPGKARLGSKEVAIYRRGALEIYADGILAARWKQPEPLWFGEIADQWVVVTQNDISLGPLQARRKMKLRQKKQVQIFSIWQEGNELHLSTTDEEGSTLLKLRLQDGKQLDPEVVRGDIDISLTSPHYTLNGQFTHPGDTNTSLYNRDHTRVLSTSDYFPTSLTEANGRVAYRLHPSDSPQDLLEVADPKAGLRWTWQGPPASACALSGDGHYLVVLADGKVYLQELVSPKP